ncbi:MAG: MBOAT family protein [Bacteroidales bacterium]|nr:MBOAT family protein [Bacteroidales bacterium]
MMDLSGISSFLAKIFSFDPNSPLLFTQFYFWAFFALVFAVFALVKNRKFLRNAFLFFVSLFFYYKTSGLSILILMFVTCSDFLISHRIFAAGEKGKTGLKRFWLILSVTIDLFLLFYFKYAYFLTDVVNTIFGSSFKVYDVFAAAGNMIGGGDYFRVDKIVLPVGISFFIFQVISYSVDVYRGDVKPVRNILDFGFYVSFFPQLVAGPIVRASEFIPQLYKKFFLGRKQFGIAVFWILNGLAKKIILSDYIAVNFIDRVFDNPLLFTGFENLAALFGYSLQVYADFSGYTDIAIGVAMLMGFYLPQNFNSPYKAPNPQHFWRRWHMSLSRWLKAYLYIPLGGNRNSTFATWFCIGLFAAIVLILSGNWIVSLCLVLFAVGVVMFARFRPDSRKKIIANLNRFITMLLGGMWHGASWNFIIWGGLNGIGLILYQFWKNMGWWARMTLVGLVTGLLALMMNVAPAPVWNMLFVWMAVLCLGTFVRFIFHFIRPDAAGAYASGLDAARAKGIPQTFVSRLGNVWAVVQTFTFITFTRLFFRSGSNLDPATANETAWHTAKNMFHQIGPSWTLSQIPAICHEYRSVFLLVLLGMVIHWLPARWKRWYRINFSMLPMPVMAVIVVAVVFLVYQFITADLQAFIYFQF